MATILERDTKDGKRKYLVQIRKKGHPTECATFTSLTKAKAWARNTEAAIDEGRHFKTVEAKKHTLGDLIDRYIESVLPNKSESTRYGQTRQLRWWKKHLGKRPLSDITPALLSEYRDNLAAEGTPRGDKRSPATVVRYMAALSHCLKVGMQEWGWLTDNPMRMVSRPREPKGRTRVLSDDERARLLEACVESNNPYLYPVVVLALSTGMRKGEILGIRWRDVQLERGLISIPDTKNKTPRAVPLVGHAHELLAGLSRIRRIDTDLVFPAPHAQWKKPKPIDIQSAWDWALERAGLGKEADFTRFHDLRHCAATYMAQDGATLAELAATLGHKTLQMVQRYQHLTAEHTSPVVARMNERIFAGANGHEASGSE